MSGRGALDALNESRHPFDRPDMGTLFLPEGTMGNTGLRAAQGGLTTVRDSRLHNLPWE